MRARLIGLALMLYAGAALAAPVTVTTLDGGRMAVEADAAALSDVMAALSDRMGFIADLGPDAGTLPVNARLTGEPTEILARILRGTNHIMVQDEGRIVRVIVLGPSTDLPGIEVAETPAAVSGAAQADPLAQDREAVAQGLAPDTGRPSGIAANMARAIAVMERERVDAWSAYAAAKP